MTKTKQGIVDTTPTTNTMMNAESESYSVTMERGVPPSSQLSSFPSTSSLSSLASQQSTAEHDTLQPQETPTTCRAEAAEASAPLSSTAVARPAGTSRPQRPSPFQSFRSPRPAGPFHPLFRGSAIAAICIACLCFSASATLGRPRNRRLEDEWTGEWNGEWTAPDGDDYEYECGDPDGCDDDSRRSSGGMWIENDVDGVALTPDQIITYVSAGMLAFMTLLCCVCYPEIILVAYGKLCGCCPQGGRGSAAASSGGGADEEALEGDYVPMGEEKEVKKKKKRRKSKGSRSSSGRRSREVELV